MEQNTTPNIPLNQRIALIMQNPEFKAKCEKYRGIELFNYLDLIERVAFLDVSKIRVNRDLLKADYPKETIIKEVYDFYADLDAICPDMPLLPIVEKNMQYLTFEPNYSRLKPGEIPRSSCGISSVVMPNGETRPLREIFIYEDGDVRTIFSGPHEFAHSMSDSFLKLEKFRSNAVAELVPSIVDVFAPELYVKRHPEHAHIIAELQKQSLVTNVNKARQSLLEACVVKVMIGELKLEDVMAKYGSIFSPQMLNDCLSDIENDNFNPLGEAKYVLPHVMAETLLTMFKQNPEETVKNIKTVLGCDSRINLDQAYQLLHLPNLQTTLKNYNEQIENQSLSK